MAKAGAGDGETFSGARILPQFISPNSGDSGLPSGSAVDYWDRYYGKTLPQLLAAYESAGTGTQGLRKLMELGLEEPDAKHIAKQYDVWNNPDLNPEARTPTHEIKEHSSNIARVSSTADRLAGEKPARLPAGTASRPYAKGEPTRLALGQLANDYAASLGFAPLDHTTTPKGFSKARATEMARVFELMKHDPNNPEVRRAYDKFIQETKDQWDRILAFQHPVTGKPIHFQAMRNFGDLAHYGESPRKMLRDLHENGHMWYFPTYMGFGDDEDPQGDPNGEKQPLMKIIYSPDDPEGAKMLERLGHQGPFRANDMFRIVHDVMGHGLVGSATPSERPEHAGTEPWKGYSFGPQGEEAAWAHHRKMYTPEARPAMTQELRGQNSWVNYGPYGQRSRAKLDRGSGATQYAEQKTGLWPEEYS